VAQQSDWAAALAAGIGERVARYRRERGLTAARLADAMTHAGAPMTRQILANLEGGRRPSVSLAELLALSHVLRVPFVALVVDYGHQEAAVLQSNAPPVLMEHAVNWLQCGDVTASAGKAFAAWLYATEITRDYSAWLTEKPEASAEEREHVRSRAALARQNARMHGLDLPAPPMNAQDVDRPVRSGVSAAAPGISATVRLEDVPESSFNVTGRVHG
jgi:transcriptional regulator with XRE-family HTH domain